MTMLRKREAELAAAVQSELEEAGLHPDRIFGIGCTGPYWNFNLEIGDRRFETGVRFRDGLFCWDLSPGNEKNLIPPATAPIFGDPARLRRGALQLVKHALHHPEFAFGEPPIL